MRWHEHFHMSSSVRPPTYHIKDVCTENRVQIILDLPGGRAIGKCYEAPELDHNCKFAFTIEAS